MTEQREDGPRRDGGRQGYCESAAELVAGAGCQALLRAARDLPVPEAVLEDAIQEVGLVIAKRKMLMEGMETDERLRRWVLAVFRCKALDQLRQLRRHRARPLDDARHLPDDRPQRAAAAEEAKRCLALLDAFLGEPRKGEPRDHLVLRRVREGLTNEQIAAELGKTVGAVKGYRRRAIIEFRTWLARHGGIEDGPL